MAKAAKVFSIPPLATFLLAGLRQDPTIGES